MAKVLPRLPFSPAEVERITMLVLRYLDNECTPEEVEQLREALADHPAQRELFVQICRMQGDLYEACASRRAELKLKAAKLHDQLSAPPIPERDTIEAIGIPALAGHPRTDADPLIAESGAETLVPELSGEDTIPPEPTGPEQ